MKATGTAWAFSGDVGAIQIVSARHDKAGMSRDWDECRRHLFEAVDPRFAETVNPGDLVVIGGELGRGHAHYFAAAVMGCRSAGIAALIAESVSGLFQRCAIDLGLLAWPLPSVAASAGTGDRLEIDFAAGTVRNLSGSDASTFDPVPGLILDIVGSGGSLAWAKHRIAARR